MGLIAASTRGARKRYTEEEVETVIEMTTKEASAKEIAKAVGRSENSVRYLQSKLRDTTAEDVEAFVKKH